MSSKHIWAVFNVALGILVLLLWLNFIGVGLPSVGKVSYVLDKEIPSFFVNKEKSDDPNRFCLEARKQLGCKKERNFVNGERTDWVCQSSEQFRYLMNNKGYNYCIQQRFW